MNIADIFPSLLLGKPTKRVASRPSWTKKGPGRRHNNLTKRQFAKKNQLMNLGHTATDALLAV